MTSGIYVEYFSLGNTIMLKLPNNARQIGIAMSGGMDSTLLAYLIFSNLPVDVKAIIYTVDLKDSKEHVSKILKFLKFHNVVEHKIIPDPKNENGALAPQFKELAKEVDYFYTASTKNPPWADEIPEGEKPKRYIETEWQNFFTPFGIYDKRIVVDLYKQYGLNNSLLPLTHTCTERSLSHCGQCFACKERKWAFDWLQLEDCILYEN